MPARHKKSFYTLHSQKSFPSGPPSPVDDVKTVMVNRGPSQGCITCRQRRVKCDETKPQCKGCLRIGRDCEGYGKKRLRVRFKNQNSRVSGSPSDQKIRVNNGSLVKSTAATVTTKAKTTSNQLALSTSHYHTSLTSSPPPVQQELALSFFLTYVTGIGRNLESTRGFMEFVRPALAVEHHSSALSTAVNAVAALLWELLDHSGKSISRPTHMLNQALLRLQKAIRDPEERERDATVLAALVLQAYETISAILGRHRADGTHRNGALALLLQRDSYAGDSKYHARLLGNILHAKVSLCVREKKPFPAHEF